jgi:hypothetical protein
MGFKLFFLFAFSVFLFSCDERSGKNMPISVIVKRRLFDIKSIEKKMPIKIMHYEQPDVPFFEVTLKNVSDFDLDLHYHKGRRNKGNPKRAAICIEYVNYPSTTGCMSFADTSCLIKKNAEFMVYIPLWMSDSQFYKDEFQSVHFRLLISSTSDLSFYFEDNPSQTQIPKYEIMELYDNRKKYTYPFEFTYWPSTGLFWEHYLLE